MGICGVEGVHETAGRGGVSRAQFSQVKAGDEVARMPFTKKMSGGGVLHSLLKTPAARDAVSA